MENVSRLLELPPRGGKAIQEAIQREIDDRTTANGRKPEYVVIYWGLSAPRLPLSIRYAEDERGYLLVPHEPDCDGFWMIVEHGIWPRSSAILAMP